MTAMFVAALLAVSVLGGAHRSPAPTSVPGVAHRPSTATPASDGPSTVEAVMAHLARIRRIPAFARRLNVSCNYCHTTIPRLNATGYKFRAAGFRMPEDIGKAPTAKFELGDYFSARIQSRFDV
ncbi:MAG TPA: hypothetical protein VF836_00185, partial [Gemmatimonadaceae bacterium]